MSVDINRTDSVLPLHVVWLWLIFNIGLHRPLTFIGLIWRRVLVLYFSLCSPCRVWPTSAWPCARAAAGRSRTATTCWPWTNSGTCAASSAASANSTWSLSSPVSARTAASTARRTTTGRGARRQGLDLPGENRGSNLINMSCRAECAADNGDFNLWKCEISCNV